MVAVSWKSTLGWRVAVAGSLAGLVASACGGRTSATDSEGDAGHQDASLIVGCPNIGCVGGLWISVPIAVDNLDNARFTVCKNDQCASTIISTRRGSSLKCDLPPPFSVWLGCDVRPGSPPRFEARVMPPTPYRDGDIYRVRLETAGIEIYAAEKAVRYTDCRCPPNCLAANFDESTPSCGL